MKNLFLTILLFALSPLFISAQINCSPILDSNTIVIKKDTVLACGGPTKSYLICPGVKASYLDNSCTSSFYLENNAEISFDSISSYGYSKVWAKNWSVLDANFRQFAEFHQETATTIRDTNSVTSPLSGKYVCPTMTFDYSRLPGGVSGCGMSAGINTIKTTNLSFEVYPNPANEFVNIKTNLEDFSLKLFNSVGKLVWTGSSKRIELNYPKGVYFLQLTNKDNSITKKVVIK